MKMTMIQDPWPHMIIDDFLPDHAFEELLDEIEEIKQTPLDFRIPFEGGSGEPVDQWINRSLIQKTYIDPVINEAFMREHFPWHREFGQLEILHHINVIHPFTEYPVHDEAPRKMLSMILYVEGDNGTTIYDENQDFVYEVEFKPNRAIVFAPITNVSYHAYSSGPDVRTTANTFLVDNSRSPKSKHAKTT